MVVFYLAVAGTVWETRNHLITRVMGVLESLIGANRKFHYFCFNVNLKVLVVQVFFQYENLSYGIIDIFVEKKKKKFQNIHSPISN